MHDCCCLVFVFISQFIYCLFLKVLLILGAVGAEVKGEGGREFCSVKQIAYKTRVLLLKGEFQLQLLFSALCIREYPTRQLLQQTAGNS